MNCMWLILKIIKSFSESFRDLIFTVSITFAHSQNVELYYKKIIEKDKFLKIANIS